MQFTVVNSFLDDEVQIRCPICDSLLTTLKEQDKRVHIMLHPDSKCSWSNERYRIERISGYGEPWPTLTEEEAKVLCQPTEDATRTSTTISAQSPPTATTKATRLIPQATPAGGHGRTRRFPGRG